MEELKRFLHLLRKNRLVILIVPAVTVIITYFMVRNLPNSYVSQAQIATGIVDQTRQNLLNQVTLQAQQVNQEFSNLIAMMRMKKMLDQVSYKLIIHDITSAKPFREPGETLGSLSASEKARAVTVYRMLQTNMSALNLYNVEQKKLYELLGSQGYDSESLGNKLSIFRSGDSDFIVIQFESEDPELSAYVVNQLSEEFIKYYSSVVRINQVKTTDFLSDLLQQKSDTLADRMADLRDYKIRNRVLNLGEQSKQLYTRIIDYEDKKQEATQNTSSYAGALDEIDKKLSPAERNYVDAALSRINQKILNTKEELSAMYDLYYKNDLDEEYKTSIDSLKRILTKEISNSSDQYINSPLAQKQSLVEQKMTLEIQLDLARYSIYSLERELKTLNSQFDELVPKEAEVQSREMSVDIASKEYLDILNRYNQSSLESTFEVKLNLVQAGIPGLAQPSKKMLLVILSGILSFVFCIAVMFILYYLDDAVRYPKDLANRAQAPVLGSLNYLQPYTGDIGKIWEDEQSAAHILFKNQLRAIRHEVEADLKGKVLVITSLEEKEGKTLVSMTLSYALMMTNKKVLLIDGNFANPAISKLTGTLLFVEDFLRGSIDAFPDGRSNITVMGNRGGDTSLVELASQETIAQKIEHAKSQYDIILIETSAFGKREQSREWLMFATDILGVFEYGKTLNDAKKTSVSYLLNEGMFNGWVLNKVIDS